MTESKWLTSTDPTPLLSYARHHFDDRKLRLFLVACARRVWDEITLKEPIEIAEAYADGMIPDDEFRRAIGPVYKAICARLDASEHQKWWDAYHMKKFMFFSSAPAFRRMGTMHLERTSAWSIVSKELGDRARPVLRCAFGNPFREVFFDPSWRTDTVLAMAKGMYESRDFSPMPILADALQDAGCDEEEILAHCRGEGPHFRGCWVVDRILGKNQGEAGAD